MLFIILSVAVKPTMRVKLIQWLEMQITQHMSGFIRRHAPSASRQSETHESTIREHILSSVTCGSNYSAEFFSVLYKAWGKLHLDILEVVLINMSHPNLCRQRELKQTGTFLYFQGNFKFFFLPFSLSLLILL